MEQLQLVGVLIQQWQIVVFVYGFSHVAVVADESAFVHFVDDDLWVGVSSDEVGDCCSFGDSFFVIEYELDKVLNGDVVLLSLIVRRMVFA